MPKKSSRKEAIKEIDGFFSDIKNKNPKDIKKAKKLAMSHNIKLGEKKRSFCKECLTPYKNPEIRIKKSIKSVVCEKCGYVARWKIR